MTSKLKEKTPQPPKIDPKLKEEEEALKKIEEKALEDEKKEDAAFEGYIERRKVVSVHYYGKKQRSRLVEFESASKCYRSIFVQGLPSVGISASVVAAYLTGHLKLPLIAVFESPLLPGMCSIHKYLATPPIRIYGNENVCVALGDQQVSAAQQSELIWDLAFAFADFARRYQCTHIVSIEGCPVKDDMQKQIQSIAKMMPKKNQNESAGREDEEEEETPIVTENEKEVNNDDKENKDGTTEKKKSVFDLVGFLTTSKEIGVALKKKEHEPVKTGQIIGITGAMLSWSLTAKPDDPPLTCLLAPDPVNLPDQRGALLVVNLLKEIWNLGIDTSELELEAKRLANKIQETIENVRQQVKRQYAPQSKPPPGMYM